MSSTQNDGPIYRLEIDYPDIRLVAPDLPEPVVAADLGSPSLPAGISEMAGRLKRDGARCVLVLPESEVWRGLVPSEPLEDTQDPALQASVEALGAPADEIVTIVAEDPISGSIGVVATKKVTLSDSLNYLKKARIRPVGITAGGEFPGFDEEPLFKQGSTCSIGALNTSALTESMKGLGASALEFATRRPAFAAAGAASIVVLAGLAVISGGEATEPTEGLSVAAVSQPETTVSTAQDAAAQNSADDTVETQQVAAKASPETPESDVIFPVDPEKSAGITPLKAAQQVAAETAAAAATKPPDDAPETSTNVETASLVVAARNSPPAPRVATESEVAETAVQTDEPTSAETPALKTDQRIELLSVRPMKRTLPETTLAIPAASEAPVTMLRPKPRRSLPSPDVTGAIEKAVEDSVLEASATAKPKTETRVAAAAPKPKPRGALAAIKTPAATGKSVAKKPATTAATATVTASAATKAVAQPTKTSRAPKSTETVQAASSRKSREQVGLSRSKVSLIGVFGSSSGRHALVRLPNGSIKKIERGDRIDGVQVAAVDRSSVRLQGGSRDTVLKMPD